MAGVVRLLCAFVGLPQLCVGIIATRNISTNQTVDLAPYQGGLEISENNSEIYRGILVRDRLIANLSQGVLNQIPATPATFIRATTAPPSALSAQGEAALPDTAEVVKGTERMTRQCSYCGDCDIPGVEPVRLPGRRSQTECVDACLHVPQCNFVAYDPVTGRCHTYDTCNSVNRGNNWVRFKKTSGLLSAISLLTTWVFIFFATALLVGVAACMYWAKSVRKSLTPMRGKRRDEEKNARGHFEGATIRDARRRASTDSDRDLSRMAVRRASTVTHQPVQPTPVADAASDNAAASGSDNAATQVAQTLRDWCLENRLPVALVVVLEAEGVRNTADLVNLPAGEIERLCQELQLGPQGRFKSLIKEACNLSSGSERGGAK